MGGHRDPKQKTQNVRFDFTIFFGSRRTQNAMSENNRWEGGGGGEGLTPPLLKSNVSDRWLKRNLTQT